MSFLTENIVRQMAAVPRVMAINVPRTFSTSIVMRKTATETVKDGLKTVDRKVSDKLVDGIDVAAKAGSKIKETANIESGEAQGKAQELRGEAAGKAQELKGQAKGAASHAAGKVKGAVDQAQSKI